MQRPRRADDRKDRPAYKTDAGRTVYGGGGIHPDVVLPPDTLLTQERGYRQKTYEQGPQYFNARLTYAVEFIRTNPDLKPGFAVTPQMRNTFYETLKRMNVTVDRPTFDTGDAA